MSGTDLKFKRIGKTDIYGYQSSKYVNFLNVGSRVSRSVHARRVRGGECGSDDMHLMV
jgi:hypothetical protein